LLLAPAPALLTGEVAIDGLDLRVKAPLTGPGVRLPHRAHPGAARFHGGDRLRCSHRDRQGARRGLDTAYRRTTLYA